MGRRVLIAAVAVAVVVPLSAWLLDWPLERAVYLAPVLVAAFGAVAGLLILWAKAGLESFRTSGRPWLLVSFGLALAALVVVLTVLGIQLPRE